MDDIKDVCENSTQTVRNQQRRRLVVDDIVKRLREWSDMFRSGYAKNLTSDAAAEIERLRADVAHLEELRQAVLRWIDADTAAKAPCDMEDATAIALERHRSWSDLTRLVKR